MARTLRIAARVPFEQVQLVADFEVAVVFANLEGLLSANYRVEVLRPSFEFVSHW